MKNNPKASRADRATAENVVKGFLLKFGDAIAENLAVLPKDVRRTIFRGD